MSKNNIVFVEPGSQPGYWRSWTGFECDYLFGYQVQGTQTAGYAYWRNQNWG